MSFLKYLRENAPINARSANFIPFVLDNDPITDGRWDQSKIGNGNTDSYSDNNDEAKPKYPIDKEQELSAIFDRLRALLVGPTDVNIEDEEFGDQNPNSQMDDEFGDQKPNSQMDDEFGDQKPNSQMDDGNREPVRRFVKNAHLVYKKQTEDGLFDELWIFNVGKDSPNDEYQIRRDILGGTDIEPPETMSKDGSQNYTTWTAGNAQLLHISGLPN